MTIPFLLPVRLMLAMGQPGESGVNPLINFLPFVAVLAIFYFIILRPMKQRQKKLQLFLDALKVGDRVVTNSGIYGQITKINERSVQLQVADKVRIEMARTAIAGYQGQDPVVPESPQ